MGAAPQIAPSGPPLGNVIPLRESAPPVKSVAAERSQLRFLACGSVDDGKSTLIGRLLYDSQLVHDDHLANLEKDSKKFGTVGEDLDFALLLDGLSAEREQGITIDVAYRYFSTPRRSFIVADTPGHEQYTRNMATGASTADLAIILIDARKGVLPQTRRHSLIVSMLGVRDVVLAVNKMDLVGNDQAVFDRIIAEYQEISRVCGFTTVQAIPLSARHGDNVSSRSDAISWYSGPALLEYLENIEIAPATAHAVFRMPVQIVSRPNLDFRGFAGTIVQGSVGVGDSVRILPSGRTSRIKGIVVGFGDMRSAGAGQAVTLTLEDEVDASRGDVIVGLEDKLAPRRAVTARLLWTSETPLDRDATYLVKLGTAAANVSVAALHHALDINDFTPRPAAALRMNELGLVQLAFDKRLVTADYAETRALGSFILIDKLTNETLGMGVIDQSAAPAIAQDEGEPFARIGAGLLRLAAKVGGPEVKGRVLWQNLSWRAVSFIIVVAVVLGFIGHAGLALGAGVVDVLARALLRRLHEAAWGAVAARPGRTKEETLFDRGGGI